MTPDDDPIVMITITSPAFCEGRVQRVFSVAGVPINTVMDFGGKTLRRCCGATRA